MKKILTESELKEHVIQIYKEEQFKLVQEKWESLSRRDKKFVIEFYNTLYPKKQINENKWYNTVGDIAGIFDPTGVVDIVNGLSYWNQGDKLFALLSWISAVPYLGDVIAKPVVGILKVGGDGAKAFKAATLTGDAVKVAEAAKNVGGPISKMVEKAPSWGEKLISVLKNSVGKVPGLGGLVKVIEEYVLLFTKAGKEMEAGGKVTAFSKNAGELQSFGNKYLSGGMGRFFGNRATRSLMRRSKWYLKLLDALGVHNFVGPDELQQQVPDLQNKMTQFNQNPSNQSLFNQEFGEKKSTSDYLDYGGGTSVVNSSSNTSNDPFSNMIGTLLGGAIKSAI
jgi:hypothetical protein